MKKHNVFVWLSVLCSAFCSFDAPTVLAGNSQMQIIPRAGFEIRIQRSGNEVLQCQSLIQGDEALIRTYSAQVNVVTPQPAVQVFEQVTEQSDSFSVSLISIGDKKLPPIQQQRILQSHGNLDDCWAGVRENLEAQAVIREMK